MGFLTVSVQWCSHYHNHYTSVIIYMSVLQECVSGSFFSVYHISPGRHPIPHKSGSIIARSILFGGAQVGHNVAPRCNIGRKPRQELVENRRKRLPFPHLVVRDVPPPLDSARLFRGDCFRLCLQVNFPQPHAKGSQHRLALDVHCFPVPSSLACC